VRTSYFFKLDDDEVRFVLAQQA